MIVNSHTGKHIKVVISQQPNYKTRNLPGVNTLVWISAVNYWTVSQALLTLSMIFTMIGLMLHVFLTVLTERTSKFRKCMMTVMAVGLYITGTKIVHIKD